MIALLLCVLLAVASAEKYNCGESSSWRGQGEADSHVVGGVPFPEHAYPWMASLERCSTFNCVHICGAVLLSADWVLINARCVNNPENNYWEVVVGQHEFETIPVDDKRRIVADSVIRHPKYVADVKQGYPYDIALIKLRTPAPIDGKTVVPAKLPSSHPKDYTSRECWISGWGRTQFNATLPRLPRHARMDVLSQAECQALMGSFISDSQICVLDKERMERGACVGDSGGPVQCKVDGVWELAGVISYAAPGCPPSFATVASRSSFFLDWIKENTGLSQSDICQ